MLVHRFCNRGVPALQPFSRSTTLWPPPQVMSLVAMETPVSLTAEDVRDEKVKVLRCVAPVSLDDVVVVRGGGSSRDMRFSRSRRFASARVCAGVSVPDDASRVSTPAALV